MSPPRVGLVAGPTPVEAWPNLSSRLGARIVAKRDDVSPIGLGGNKVRKLDLILGEAMLAGMTDVITIGGLQSNHCRLTAASCARLGLRSHLFLRGDDPAAHRVGNLLLDELFGANVYICDVEVIDEMVPRMHQLATELRAQGGAPLVVPLGGSTPLGTLAYVLAVHELREQLGAGAVGDAGVDRIIVAAGTGGTLAGIALGCSLFLPETTVVGVSVSRPAGLLSSTLDQFRSDAQELLGHDAHLGNVDVVDEHVGAGYTIPNPATSSAVRLLARTEGVLGDLTYTGKALEYLVNNPAPAERPTATTLFWHTGGTPELFARPAHELLDVDPAVPF